MKNRLEQQSSFLFHFQTFNEIKDSLYHTFGASAYTILYYSGIFAGRRAYERRAAKTKTKEETLQLLTADKINDNWGEIIFQDLDFTKLSGRILVKNCFEARAAKTKQPICYFFKGYLTGFLSGLMQKPVLLDEVRCLAKGDEHCEFTIAPDRS